MLYGGVTFIHKPGDMPDHAGFHFLILDDGLLLRIALKIKQHIAV
ncbi:hypothetical protein PAAL109150_14775 [Paenibacillus alkaliterrae]